MDFDPFLWVVLCPDFFIYMDKKTAKNTPKILWKGVIF